MNCKSIIVYVVTDADKVNFIRFYLYIINSSSSRA